jgi:hypothetical protein
MVLKSIDFTLVESEPSRQFQLFMYEAYSDLDPCMKIGQRFAVLVYLLINDGFLTTTFGDADLPYARGVENGR